MWSLQFSGDKGSLNGKSPADIRLLCGTEYVVGRRDVNILLRDDPSISRKHATLFVTFTADQLGNHSSIPEVSLTDFSKFGTAVGGKLMSGSTCVLADGDQVKFGQMQNLYKVKYTPLVVATSALPSTDKVLLKQYLLQLGGHQVNEWHKDCTVLLMGKVGVTVKAVCALASQKPVVTIEYIEKLISTAKAKAPEPSINGFTPVLAEEGDKYILQPKLQRQRLFEGKTFFFCNKGQFDRMKLAVQLAGGTVLLLERKPRSLSKLTADSAILMYCVPTAQPDWYKDCCTYLTRHNMRYIQDAEIGHAVLYCSTDRHCNPQQEAGAKLHQEFSQKLTNTQMMTQSMCQQPQSVHKDSSNAKITRKVGNTPSHTPSQTVTGSVNILAADTQQSTRSRPADRSVYIADMLPPPSVTLIMETQKSTQHSTPRVKLEVEIKRKPDSQIEPPAKRIKASFPELVPASQTVDSSIKSKDLAIREDNASTQADVHHMQQVTVSDETSLVPSMRDVTTPEKYTISQEVEKATCYDDSIVAETQSSGSSARIVREVAVDIKPETMDVDRLADVKNEPMPPSLPTNRSLSAFSEERKQEIGDSWDTMQVDYALLFRKTKPPSVTRLGLQEKEGMVLWKGKWVPNFKRFKKCGKKSVTRLPTIIGGGDFVDGLCSQQESQSDFVQMPSQEAFGRSREVIAPRIAPAKTTIKSSIFGGQWELPSAKR